MAEASTVSIETTNSPTLKRRRRTDLLSPIKRKADVLETPVESRPKRQDLDVGVGVGVMSSSSLSSVEQETPKFGMSSIRGRRRDMEDAVSIHLDFCQQEEKSNSGFHFFALFDGHGCSHVAFKCRDRFHKILKEEFESNANNKGVEWKRIMERTFTRMDKEAEEKPSNCRCGNQTLQCDAVGSTAVVAVVTPKKIILSNCGDSRAVLSRNGVVVPLSSDHKPDRPDELARIEEAGGRVIYWDGARVLGVLAMSRAIGDNYLKPYVISDPEVTIIDRMDEDECLILATDGLWDVVSNDTACGVARMCLKSRSPDDKACSDASILLTKLALARESCDNVSVVVVDIRR